MGDPLFERESPIASRDTLRNQSEDRIVSIARVSGSLTFPANFMLAGAMNPCPCGYHGDPVRECTCSLTQVLRYQKRISGPLLDRIDIHIDVPRVEYDKLTSERLGESSAQIRARVERARERQRARFHGTELQCNGDIGPEEVRQYCELEETGKGLLRSAMQQMSPIPRALRGR